MTPETQPEPAPAAAAVPWRVAHAFGVWVAGNFAAVLAAVLWNVAGGDLDSVAALFLIGAVQILTYVALIVMLGRRLGTGRLRDDFGLRVDRSDPVAFLWGVGLLFVWLVAASVILTVLGVTEPPTQEVVETASEAAGLSEIVLVVLVAAVAVPVAEELLFRGLLLQSLRRRMSDRAAVWVSALAFGAAHLVDPNALIFVPALALIGVVLAGQAVKTGRLGRPIFTHIGFNSASILLTLLAAGT